MDDDFNTGGAVGVLYELLTTLNRFADANKSGRRARQTPRRTNAVSEAACRIAGAEPDPRPVPRADYRGRRATTTSWSNGLMQAADRPAAEARKAKNFAMADQIRKRLTRARASH